MVKASHHVISIESLTSELTEKFLRKVKIPKKTVKIQKIDFYEKQNLLFEKCSGIATYSPRIPATGFPN